MLRLLRPIARLSPHKSLCRSILSYPIRQLSSMKIVPVPVRDDNYAYLIVDESTKQAAAVDPYDVAKVTAAADSEGVKVVACITTHHHHDHSGGNKVFASTYPDAIIYAGSEKSPAATKILKDKDEFTLGDNIRIKCLATPCHTQDSICYHVTDAKDSSDHPGGAVFTGDTLFVAGCGRFFEGNGAEMHAALSYLGTLPDATRVYNGHEYTAGSLAFGLSVDPTSAALARLAEIVRANKQSTGMTTIGDEKEWNVFMRLRDPVVLGRVHKEKPDASTDAQIIDVLRELKNSFRG
ncbi:Metallo-hydrolase/oxidoreductase [Roridomyces roridus]|uniref:hydroxyacylglutathione hydrolase n=1 Tax=Roridomyces roridus TaxID=1738132 RepID=A0AAD7BVN7_9AGAR|nr:Metallo-hydrolase/oxidoreductase [Roridomyces roridus]